MHYANIMQILSDVTVSESDPGVVSVLLHFSYQCFLIYTIDKIHIHVNLYGIFVLKTNMLIS